MAATPSSTSNPPAADEATLPGDTVDDVPPTLLNAPPTDPEKAAAAAAAAPIDTSEPGAKWRNNEMHDIPYKWVSSFFKDPVLNVLSHSNMKLVFPGLMMTVFLAALDQTIAAVALPTIVADIGGQSGYSWVGSAYLLSAFFLLVEFVYFIDYFFISSVRLRQPALWQTIGHRWPETDSLHQYRLVPLWFCYVRRGSEFHLARTLPWSARHWRRWNFPDDTHHHLRYQ